MDYYVSKNHNTLNKRKFSPELIGTRVCLSPLYNVELERPVEVLLDSGAFQDTRQETRVSFQGALDRQLAFETDVGFSSRFLVSYDWMVDEASGDGRNKHKQRVSYSKSEKCVDQTISAAKYLADQRRDLIPRRLVLSSQGITAPQYLRCVREILSFAQPEDVLGLGGFCIIGQVPSLKKQYYRVLEGVLPLMRKRGLRRLHLFGIGTFGALVRTHMLCRNAGIRPSYDTSSYEFNSVMGKVFQPDFAHIGPDGPRMTAALVKRDKYRLYHPRDWAHFNIGMINHFWSELEKGYPIKGDRRD